MASPPHATTLWLPLVDFWLFDDDRLVLFGHFAGDGQWFGNEQIEDAGWLPGDARHSNRPGSWELRTLNTTLP
ncbi:DUF6879 family protein [Nocardia pseudovaccinii]|uniref:DUF6879 family protein n=1 Tax=Nocardia pseudovaccinii TaxID=189540 RepID=UPI003D8F8C18